MCWRSWNMLLIRENYSTEEIIAISRRLAVTWSPVELECKFIEIMMMMVLLFILPAELCRFSVEGLYKGRKMLKCQGIFLVSWCHFPFSPLLLLDIYAHYSASMETKFGKKEEIQFRKSVRWRRWQFFQKSRILLQKEPAGWC